MSSSVVSLMTTRIAHALPTRSRSWTSRLRTRPACFSSRRKETGCMVEVKVDSKRDGVEEVDVVGDDMSKW